MKMIEQKSLILFSCFVVFLTIIVFTVKPVLSTDNIAQNENVKLLQSSEHFDFGTAGLANYISYNNSEQCNYTIRHLHGKMCNFNCTENSLCESNYVKKETLRKLFNVVQNCKYIIKNKHV